MGNKFVYNMGGGGGGVYHIHLEISNILIKYIWSTVEKDVSCFL